VLSEEDRSAIVEAVGRWAQSLDPEVRRHEPVIGVLGHAPLTAEELYSAMVKHTPDGEAILEIIEHTVSREGREAAVARILRTAGAPAPR
jgi:hypothetical protein